MSDSFQFLRRSAVAYFFTHILGVSIVLVWLLGLSQLYWHDIGLRWRLSLEQSLHMPLPQEVLVLSTYLCIAIVVLSLFYAFYKIGMLNGTHSASVASVASVRRRMLFSLIALLAALLVVHEWVGLDWSKSALSLQEHHLPVPNHWVVFAAALFSLYFVGHVLALPHIKRMGLYLGSFSVLAISVLELLLGEGDVANCISALIVVWLWCSIMFYPLWLDYERTTYRQRGQSDIHQTWEFLSIIQVNRRRTFRNYGLLLALIIPFFAPTWQQAYTIEVVRAVGVVLMVVAIIGRCWCTLYLGGHKGQDLISAGPYSVTRNPLYVFSVLAALGMGAQSGSICVALLMGGIVYAVFSKVIAEEELLLRKVFGDQFERYCATVPRFWPNWQGWHSSTRLLISLPELTRTLRDALPYLMSVPLFISIHWAQVQTYLPVLVRLP